MASDCAHKFKLVIIGDSYVGKTSLLLCLTEDNFFERPPVTLGVDYRIKRLNIDGETIQLDIWDTAGQERFRVITKTYYRNADGVIVVYDVTNGDSFLNVQTWLEEINKNAKMGLPRILVGNKDDNPEKKAVTSEDALRVAQDLGVDLYETSAKNGINVSQAFEAISQLMVKRKKIRQKEEMAENKIQLNKKYQNDKKPPQKCC